MGFAKELTASSSMKKIIVERGWFKTTTKMEKERANNVLATP
jgi:cytochrome oxidase assembly protein ShyY1